MKLTDVARASLCELRGDYETWLMLHGAVPWRRDAPEAKAVFSLRSGKNAGREFWGCTGYPDCKGVRQV